MKIGNNSFLQKELGLRRNSTNHELAGIAAKAANETRYHVRHAGEWVIRLGDGTEESHGRAQDALDDAQYLLEAVLELEPDDQAARHDYAQVLIKRQMYREADQQARLLLEREPGNLEFRALDATAAVGLGQHERAIDIYRALTVDAPGSWDVPLWMGHALKTVGRTAEALERLTRIVTHCHSRRRAELRRLIAS